MKQVSVVFRHFLALTGRLVNLMKYHPIYNAYGAGTLLNNLKGEFDEIPSALRKKWLKKYARRKLILGLTGQALLERSVIPKGVKTILWYYDWNTLGDSIMDLSQRHALAAHYQVDICMPSGPAALFEGDPAFRRVITDIRDRADDYDFVLLHDISSRSVGMKLRYFPCKPWASMIRHQQGEQYARSALSAFRLGQLLDTPNMQAERPSIAPFEKFFSPNHNEVRVAVSLGGVDPRRRYQDWPLLLQELIKACSQGMHPIRFVLVGSGTSAHEDAARISAGVLKTHCELALDLPDLQALRDCIAGCDYFIGGDSGPMHLAEALDKPGVALFGHIRPEWRLLGQSRLETCFDNESVNKIDQNLIINAFRVALGKEGLSNA